MTNPRQALLENFCTLGYGDANNKEHSEGKLSMTAAKGVKTAARTTAKSTGKATGKTTTPTKSKPVPAVKAAPETAEISKSSPAVAPTVVPQAKAVVLGPVMRKKELIDRVVERSGIKKKDAKPVVEAMLGVLGEALAEKRELALQPLGKIKIKRERELPNGRMLVTRIRQSSGPATVPEPKPLADADE